MSEQGTCKECRKWEHWSTLEGRARGGCQRDERHEATTWGDGTCPSFERKRDKWERTAAQIMNYWSQNENWSESCIEDILRRHFPEPDPNIVRAAVKNVLRDALNCNTDELLRILDAVLAAIEGEVKPCE